MSSTETSLPPQLAKIVERFQRRCDPKQKYKQLLWYAQKLPPMSAASKTEANKVKGCVSQVYITAALADGKVQYQGDSDAQLVKGLVAFLIEGLNNLPPAEIAQIEPSFIEDTGLKVSLTPSRANGFFNIFHMMKQQALNLSLDTAKKPTSN
ncbi:cysteine desulfuration protein SufE [Pleurocapsa sp. CCALA 161]|uniref:SufE family protein n=1 Tax=Pleurocapsa sp. CCALA 161 TaxID=2107688 RepID=UPI000D04EFD9|nr:SufE family protein [Pleurocapsa sp. CCALA 161]PSB09456.1 cysteine desulfuration protein SufE [Pleurocapsa sp. CCALA 161]